ncbi:VOC family protein [Nocardia brasiliensis]|uniref:VOC family protein n=1 Tax=Nocardia brasiliensis TaxID=37326 RepID=UPI00367229CB
MSGFDHLVLATPDLAATVGVVTRALGVAPVAGGRHMGYGTRNFLLGLGDGYLEIIGPDLGQPVPRLPRPFGINGLTAPRLATWAVRVTDIDKVVTDARAAGYDPGDVADMSRATPEGRTLRWRLTWSRKDLHRGLIPFLIDWGETTHPSAGLPQATLRSLEAVHPDPAVLSLPLQALSAPLPVHPGIRAGLIAVIEGPNDTLTLL